MSKIDLQVENQDWLLLGLLSTICMLCIKIGAVGRRINVSLWPYFKFYFKQLRVSFDLGAQGWRPIVSLSEPALCLYIEYLCLSLNAGIASGCLQATITLLNYVNFNTKVQTTKLKEIKLKTSKSKDFFLMLRVSPLLSYRVTGEYREAHIWLTHPSVFLRTMHGTSSCWIMQAVYTLT